MILRATIFKIHAFGVGKYNISGIPGNLRLVWSPDAYPGGGGGGGGGGGEFQPSEKNLTSKKTTTTTTKTRTTTKGEREGASVFI